MFDFSLMTKISDCSKEKKINTAKTTEALTKIINVSTSLERQIYLYIYLSIVNTLQFVQIKELVCRKSKTNVP